MVESDGSISKDSQGEQDSEQRVINGILADNTLPTEVIEAVGELPPNQQMIVKSMLTATASITKSPSSLLARSVTPEHISKTLQNNDQERERQFKRDQAAETTKRLGIGAILSLILMVLIYAGVTSDKETADKVIIAGITGIGGAIGGFGAGVAYSKK